MHCWDEQTANSGRWGWLLAFHPDFVRKYPLGEKILRLRYFSYEVDEALHISDSERKTVEGIMDGIESEYLQGVDRHTQDIIVAQLDVLFCYAERFYDRQFRMRSNAEPDILVRVQRMFRQHLDERRGEFLSVSAVASELNMQEKDRYNAFGIQETYMKTYGYDKHRDKWAHFTSHVPEAAGADGGIGRSPLVCA